MKDLDSEDKKNIGLILSNIRYILDNVRYVVYLLIILIVLQFISSCGDAFLSFMST